MTAWRDYILRVLFKDQRTPTSAELRSLLEEAAADAGVKLIFEAGSEPQITLVVNHKPEDAVTNSFSQKNVGAVGAAAQGVKAEANNRGTTTQHIVASRENLAIDLSELLRLVDGINPGSSDRSAEARLQLKAAVAEASKPEPAVGQINAAWSKVRPWVDGLLALGVFAIETEEKVQKIVGRVTQWLA